MIHGLSGETDHLDVILYVLKAQRTVDLMICIWIPATIIMLVLTNFGLDIPPR